MKVLTYIKRRRWLLVALACLLVAAAIITESPGTAARIDSYVACTEAGYPVLQADPPICRAGVYSFTGTPLPQLTPAPARQAVDFEILVDGDTQGQLPDHRQDFIDSSADWQAYWRAVHATLATLPPIIPVNFTTSSVVAVSLGRQATGGYGLKITGIASSAAGTTVSLTETTPTITCPVTQSPSNRYLIVRTPKLAQPVSFRISSDKRHCQ